MPPKIADQGDGFRGGAGGGAEQNQRARTATWLGGPHGEIAAPSFGFAGHRLGLINSRPGFAGKAAGLGGNGDAFFRPVGAVGQVGDGKARRGRGQHRARRGHAIQQPEDFELGFQLIRDTIDHQVGLADRLLDGGNKGDGGQGFRVAVRDSGTELLAQELLGVMQITGHHVLQQHREASAGSREGQPAAQRSSPDDGNGRRQADFTWRPGPGPRPRHWAGPAAGARQRGRAPQG